MTGFQLFALIIITCLIGFDATGPQTQLFNRPVILGWLLGALFGDIQMGLFIGGTIQLMSMGVVGLAGASVPNYVAATLIAVPIAITTGEGFEAGMAIGLPVAMLMVQLDIMTKIGNGFIARASQNYCNKGEFKKMNLVLYLCIIFQILKYMVPVLLSVLAGIEVVNAVLKYLPDWFMGGLNVAGKILPVVGIAVLLNYMPAKKYVNYLIIGFVMFAYLKVPMMGCALIGFALAFKFYKDKIETISNPVASIGGLEDE